MELINRFGLVAILAIAAPSWAQFDMRLRPTPK
jgi:hypothetical protein